MYQNHNRIQTIKSYFKQEILKIFLLYEIYYIGKHNTK